EPTSERRHRRRCSIEFLAITQKHHVGIYRRTEQRQPGTRFQARQDIAVYLDGAAVRAGFRIDAGRRGAAGAVLQREL
ncbi:MAG: hypothetical protein, partial [Olavius algarvensis Gamma 3 endosymbiont]